VPHKDPEVRRQYMREYARRRAKCKECGRPLGDVRSPRCRPCSKRGERNPNWKGDAAAVQSGRGRAIRATPLAALCERCKKRPASERHHVDGNTCNNARENLLQLCRTCHMKLDGRLEAFAEMAHGRAKISDHQVEELRSAHRAGVKATILAERYGMSLSQTWRIIRYERRNRTRTGTT